MYSRDRSRSAVDQISRALVDGSLYDDDGFYIGPKNAFFQAVRPFYSSFAPTGRFFRPDMAAAITVRQYATTATSFRRWSHQRLGDPARQRLQPLGVPHDRRSDRALECGCEGLLRVGRRPAGVHRDRPTPVRAPRRCSSRTRWPRLTCSTRTAGAHPDGASTSPNGSGGFDQVILDNPTVPAYTLAIGTDQDGDGLKDLYFTRRMAEIGNRGNKVDRNTFQGIVGMRGQVLQHATGTTTRSTPTARRPRPRPRAARSTC